jgi:poly-gamma-glutamate capsule biosynthesis protein CapA/YwtB (metallophosphatase superfamily)
MRARLVAGVGIATLIAVGVGTSIYFNADHASSARRTCTDGTLSVAAVGDIMMGSDTAPAERVADETGDLLKASSVTVGNLATTLLDKPDKAEASGPKGGAKQAALLHRWGFSALSRANDHANDFGSDGLEQTTKILQDKHLVSAGVGADLAAARAPGWVKTPCGQVAIISIATSLRDQDPALPTRGDIAGRPGVNPLRFTLRLEVDPTTYATLRQESAKMGGPPPEADGTLHAFGMTVQPGERTLSAIIINANDKAEVLAAITEARKTATLVVVSLHSHEQGNTVDEPAPFVEAFAREAINAGAGLVVGHGPHRLRPVEFHGNGLIAYSLGDFVADRRLAAALSSNPFDAPFTVAEQTVPQGAILSASFRDGRVVSARLTALDLAAAQDLPQGFPRRASSAEVLTQIESGSAARGAKLSIQEGSADIVPTAAREPGA